MCTIVGRDKSVLLVVDVQNGVVWDAFNRAEIVQRIAELVDQARVNKVPVVWVQHNDEEMPVGSEYWQLVPELEQHDAEPLVHKTFRSSFEATDLEVILAGLNAAELIVVGAQTNNCIRSTSYAALERGYDVTLVEDAHTTSDQEWDHGVLSAEFVIDEQNRTLEHNQLPGRRSRVVPAADVFK